jgi:formylmethanofuran dehydrogenase subunit A
MAEILIKNGNVFDPLNDVEGEKMDIAVKDGKIVEDVGPKAEVIDASGMIVMPGGLDIHSHVAGPKVNVGRILRPEDHERDFEVRTSVTRSGVGRSIPSTFITGYRYARMGYTTVFEPASPPLKTRHTHEELNDIPILDKGCYPLFGNNWFVMEYLKEGRLKECAAYVAWTINAIKGYAIKLVNPGGVEAWGWGRNVRDLDDPVPYFEITPREIIRGLCKVNKMLNLPHTIHVHTNNLGKPGNYFTTIETMDCVRNLASGDKPNIHITHVQFNGFTGNSWMNLGSGAPEIADYVNKRRHVTIDIGQVIFTDTTTMTADGPFQYILHGLSGNKWVNSDIESETGAGVVPFHYKRGNYVNAIQWGIGLELALLIENPWQVYLTTDHPNGGPFTAYPRIISWLMSKAARDKVMKKINRSARRRLDLPGIDREYTFYEIAVITRAGIAKSLGLRNKGRLNAGADADIAIYNIDIAKANPSREFKLVRRAFKKAAYTIKDGVIVVKDGVVVESHAGRTYWVNSKIPEDLEDKVEDELKSKFKDYYTVEMENYLINEDYLAISSPIEVNSEV